MKDDDPSYADELARFPAWDRTLWLSRAYIEAGYCLCSAMLEGEFSSQYSSSRVILSLVRHGIELFLKGAIQASGQNTDKLGHNLDALFLAYREAHPSLAYTFAIPRLYQVDLNADLFPESIYGFHRTLDQRHRYADDKRGESFATPEIFDPTATRDAVSELRRELGIIEWVHLRPSLNARNAAYQST